MSAAAAAPATADDPDALALATVRELVRLDVGEVDVPGFELGRERVRTESSRAPRTTPSKKFSRISSKTKLRRSLRRSARKERGNRDQITRRREDRKSERKIHKLSRLRSIR